MRLCPPAVLSQLYSVGYHAWALQERVRWVLDKLVWWLYDAQSFILSILRNDLTTFDGRLAAVATLERPGRRQP